MKDVQERIEGSFRLMAFRRMKRGIFILEIVMLLAIAMGVMILMGANLNPGYLPLDFFLLIMTIMALLLVIEYQYFRLLEITHTKSKSGKYLIARNNIRSAAAVIVICAVLVALFALPQSVQALESGTDVTSTLHVDPGKVSVYNYTSRDLLGTKTVKDLYVSVGGSPIKMYLWLSKDYETRNTYNRLINKTDFSIGDSLYYPSSQNFNGFKQFVIYVNNTGSVRADVTIHLTYDISTIFTSYIPLLGIIFIIAEGLTISYFLPIREKYSASSIFSKNYVEDKDAGAEKLSERTMAIDKTLTDEEITKAVEESAPPPKAAEVKAQPEVRPEQARKKGVLDVEPTIQKDVPCPSCGSMNSQDSSMCFSCGAVLAQGPKVSMGPDELMHKGRDFLRAQRYQDAIWCFDEILKEDHKHEQALFLKAKALSGEKRYELAIQYLNTVIQQNPAHQMAFTTRGEIFEELEMYDRAIDSYEKALALGPDEEISKKLKDLKEGDKEEVLNQFMMLPGIGPAKAAALYDAGFTNIEAIRNAPVDNLAKVKGVGERLAKRILKEMGRE